MDQLTFISKIIESLAWPTSVLVIVFLLRGSIAALIPGMRKLKYKELEIDFGERLSKVRAELSTIAVESSTKKMPPEIEPEPLPKTQKELKDKLAEISPHAAILESWKNIERTLDFYFGAKNIERPKSSQTISGHLDYDPNFPPQLVSAYQELRLLRNNAAHTRESVSTEQAKEYASLADQLTYALIEAAH